MYGTESRVKCIILAAYSRADSQGFYVNLDFHSNGFQDQGVSSNESFANQTAWINNWKTLLTDLTKTSANKGKILVDLINEPDGYDSASTSRAQTISVK